MADEKTSDERGDYVVYARPGNEFSTIRLRDEWTFDQVAEFIARYEATRADVEYLEPVRPWSFNMFFQMEVSGREEAIAKARRSGLVFEPLKTVWERHQSKPSVNILMTADETPLQGGRAMSRDEFVQSQQPLGMPILTPDDKIGTARTTLRRLLNRVINSGDFLSPGQN